MRATAPLSAPMPARGQSHTPACFVCMASLTHARVLFAWPVSHTHTRVFVSHSCPTPLLPTYTVSPVHSHLHFLALCLTLPPPPPSSSRLRLDEIGVRYADTEPEYLFHIKGDDYIDGNCSTHYSRYFNHAEDGRLDPSIPPPLPHPTLHPSPFPRRPTPPPTPHRPTPPSPPHPTACA